ncbi:MAG TPA: alpha-amylase family glycosyl hydrolase [Polyangiaceae bacterium]|nr:alpha-amylase family glycosyl hydrolase [Polyangiaceae bacterium]
MATDRAPKRSRIGKRLLGLGATLLVGLLVQSGGCMSYDEGLEGEILMSSQVVDWRDEVIYQVLVDRFADGDAGNDDRVDRNAMGRYHGGDWKGLEDHLDYLQELGVTTIWISPIIKNVDTDAGFDAYHGYWAQDLTALNPHFGDLPALRSLVFAAHEKKMKVIVDIVTNHMGQLFYYDINMNGEPDDRVAGDGVSSDVTHVNEYDPDFDPRGVQSRTSLGEAGPAPIVFVYDPKTNHMPPLPEVFQDPRAFNRRGRTVNFEDPDQLVHGDFPGGLKDVNTTLCGPRDGVPVKEAMVDAYARWVELTDIDGFRIDTVKHVEREFWRYFTQKLRQRLDKGGKHNFIMFGEAFDGRDNLVGAYTKTDLPPPDQLALENQCVSDGVPITGDQLDSVFYFPQYFQAIRDVFQSGLSTKRIEDLWAQRKDHYGTTAPALGIGVPPADNPINFIDNHDVPRFLFNGSRDGLHNALTFVFTAQGIPCVYYGTEQELAGGNDPSNREDLWPTGFPTDGDTFKHIQKLAAIRKSSAAIRRGGVTVVWSSDRINDEEDAGIFAFERAGGDAGDDYALVVLNANQKKASAPVFQGAPMKVNVPEGTELVDRLGSDQTFTVGAGGTLVINPPLPAESALVLTRP